MNSVTFHSMALVGQPAWLWLVADTPGDPRENGVRRREEESQPRIFLLFL